MANPVVTYLKESVDELKKVSWPSRKDTTRLSLIVIGGCLIVGAFFTLLDFGLSRGLDSLINLINN